MPISFNEQAALLVRLKERISNVNERSDALMLLSRLRKRDDLYVKVAQEIDDLLGSTEAIPLAQDNSSLSSKSSNSKTQPSRVKPELRARIISASITLILFFFLGLVIALTYVYAFQGDINSDEAGNLVLPVLYLGVILAILAWRRGRLLGWKKS